MWLYWAIRREIEHRMDKWYALRDLRRSGYVSAYRRERVRLWNI